MSKEFQERMFNPSAVRRIPWSVRLREPVSGMTIARNIARRMNGDITVKSSPGKGSQFVVTLSFRLADTAVPQTDRLVDIPVLVVDNDEAASQMTCMILEHIGMKGEYVLSGGEALERIWERHQLEQDYFAVILDWRMPGMDGG